MQKNNFSSISNEFQIDRANILGKGSTGQVYFGRQIETNSPVAVKLIRLDTIDNEVTRYLFKMEKLALTLLNHENVLRGIKIIQNSSKCYMVTEFCSGGTLKQLIQKKEKLSEQQALQIIKGVLKGYNSLVRRRIVHRDLKPANIMLHNNTPKIIDFGYCEVEGHEKPTLQYNVGSPSYMAPQSFHQNIYNQKSQIWSIGVILYECLIGKTFDDGKHMSIVYKQLKKNGLPLSSQISQKCQKIIMRCLQMNPNRRPTALQLLDELIQKRQSSTKQPDFIILEKKKSMSLFMSTQSGLLSKKSVSKNKFIKHPSANGTLHPQRSGSGHSCVQAQAHLNRKTSRQNQIYGITDRVILGAKQNKFNDKAKKLHQYVKDQYGLTSRGSCTDQFRRKTCEYIFSPQTGFTYVSTTPSKVEQQTRKQNRNDKSPIPKINKLLKNPQSLTSSKNQDSKKQVPFEQYFSQTSKNLTNNNPLPLKLKQKQIYVPFDYRKVYAEKGNLKMTLKKENVNHDLGQYIFSDYVSPQHNNMNNQKPQYVQQQAQESSSVSSRQKNVKITQFSATNSPSTISTPFKSQKQKPVSFFSKIFSPFSQKAYR